MSDQQRSRIPALSLTSRGDEGLWLPAALLLWLGTSACGRARRANPNVAGVRGRAHASPGRGFMRTRAGRGLKF